jgi:hypothetical protein
MPLKGLSQDRPYHHLVTFLFLLAVFLIQFLLRDIDDNRLTSWRWTFTDVDMLNIFIILVVGIAFAYVLSRSSFPEKKHALFLFLSSFVVCIFFWQEPEVIVDVSRYFTQAKHLELYGIKYFILEWGRGINAWTDLPLIPFLYGMLFKLFGESRIYIQVFTTFLFSMTCVLTYLIGRSLWDEDIGFFAGMLLLGIPYIFTQVPLMLVDVPTMFFLTLLIFVFIKAIEKGRVYIFLSSIAVFLCVFSKYSTWLMLSVIFIIPFVYWRYPSKDQRHWHKLILQRMSAFMYVSGILILAFLLLKFDVFSAQIRLLLEYQVPGLRRWGEGFVSTFFYQVHPFMTLSVLYSIVLAFKKRDLRYLIVSWLLILIFILQIRRARYILITFPMFALMASYGLQEIKAKGLRRFFVYGIVCSSIVIAMSVYLPFLEKLSLVNLKDAGNYLDSIDAEYVEVLIIPSHNTIVNPAISIPILDIFTKKQIYYTYNLRPPAFEKIEKSPLRFTWEYRNPEYYKTDGKGFEKAPVVVVITNGENRLLPGYVRQKIKDYKRIKVFNSYTGIFRYSPVVSVYY